MIPYMTFAGKNLLTDMQTVVDFSTSFGNPERSYEYVEIMGKNGSLVIDNNRFNDLEIDFPAFILKDFIPNYRNLMAFLNSQKGYQRLETSYEPDHYRKALFLGTVQPEPTQFLKKGSFTLPFRVHPQRYLKSGDIPVSASSQSNTYTGNPVEIDNPSGISAVNSLAVALNPIQNLNGYDSPWVGGAGKNLFNKDATPETSGAEVTTTNTGLTVTTTVTGNNKYVRYEMPLSILGKTVTLSANITRSSTNNGSARLYFYTSNSNVGSAIGTLAGNSDGAKTVTFDIPAELPEGATRLVLLLYAVTTGTTGTGLSVTYDDLMLEIGSTASAYEPYENICPITGHTSASVTRYQDNLFDGETITGGYYNTGGVWVASSNIVGAKNIIRVQGGERLYIASLDKAIQITAFSEYVNIGEDGSNAYISRQGRQNTVYNVPSNAKYLYFNFPSSYGSTYKNDLSINTDPNDTELHEPAQTVTVDLNGTRYGGTLDVLTGVLTVDRVSVIADPSLSWRYASGSGGYFYLSAAFPNLKRNGQVITNLLPTVTTSEEFASTENCVYCATNINIKVNGVNTVSDFQTWLTTNSLQVVYEIEPTTVQLTPQQISLLTGINYISSSDEVTVTVSEPSLLENPTLFESKPLIRVHGNGTLTVNNQHITIAENPYEYIDIDCDIMDAFYGANNANRYVTLPNDYVVLKSGANYIAYDGAVEITPRWYEV